MKLGRKSRQEKDKMSERKYEKQRIDTKIYNARHVDREG